MSEEQPGKPSRAELLSFNELAGKIVNTVREPMLVLDVSLRVVFANESFCATFRVDRAETEARSVFELGQGEWNIPRLRELLESVLPDNEFFDDFEVEHHFTRIGRRTMLLNARRIDHVDRILLAIEDVTTRRDDERHLRRVNNSLEEKVASRVEAIQILQDVAVAANESRSVTAVLQVALNRICRYSRWLVGHAYQISQEEPHQLVSAGASCINEEELGDDEERHQQLCQVDRHVGTLRFSAGRTIVGRVLETGRPHWTMEPIDVNHGLPQKLSALRIVSAVAFPVKIDDEVEAVLLFFAERPIHYEAHFLGIMENVGYQISHLIRRKQLERHAADASEREQRRIGSDIHDGVGQELTGLRYLAQTQAELLAGENSPHAEIAQRISAGLERLKSQLRAVISELIPVEVDEQGLVSALQSLAEMTHRDYPVSCTLESTNVVVADNLVATHLFRIAQEAVANSLKHSGAQRIVIRLSQQGSTIQVEVEDDGAGLHRHRSHGRGFGIRNMEFRASLLGSRLIISPSRLGGTRVCCTTDLQKGLVEIRRGGGE